MADRNDLFGGTAHGIARRAADMMEVLLADPAPPDQAARAEAVLLAHGEIAPVSVSPEGLDGLRQVAAELRAVFAAADAAEAAAALNRLLAAHARQPRLTAHNGRTAWHLHVDSDDENAPWGEWFLTSSCVALAVLLTERQAPPAGFCASPSCGRPFVNTGRGGGRRYCSAACGSRERVAAHRAARLPAPWRLPARTFDISHGDARVRGPKSRRWPVTSGDLRGRRGQA